MELTQLHTRTSTRSQQPHELLHNIIKPHLPQPSPYPPPPIHLITPRQVHPTRQPEFRSDPLFWHKTRSLPINDANRPGICIEKDVRRAHVAVVKHKLRSIHSQPHAAFVQVLGAAVYLLPSQILLGEEVAVNASDAGPRGGRLEFPADIDHLVHVKLLR